MLELAHPRGQLLAGSAGATRNHEGDDRKNEGDNDQSEYEENGEGLHEKAAERRLWPRGYPKASMAVNRYFRFRRLGKAMLGSGATPNVRPARDRSY